MRTTTYDALVDELSDRHGRDSILRYLEGEGEDEIRTAIAEIGKSLAQRIRPYTTPRSERLVFRSLVEFRWDAPIKPELLANDIDISALVVQARHDTPIRTVVHGTWIHARTVNGAPQEIPLAMERLASEDRAWRDAHDAALDDPAACAPWSEFPGRRNARTASIELGTYQTLEHTLTREDADTSQRHGLRLATHLRGILDNLPGPETTDKAWLPVEGSQTPGHLVSITIARTRYAAPLEHQGLAAYTAAFSRAQTMRALIPVVGPRHAPVMAVHRAFERANASTDWKQNDHPADIRFDAIVPGDRDPYTEGYVPEGITP